METHSKTLFRLIMEPMYGPQTQVTTDEALSLTLNNLRMEFWFETKLSCLRITIETPITLETSRLRL
jgi:hypothetical protein